MACDVQTLITESQCFLCGTPGDWELEEIALLCALANRETISCDPQALLSTAQCYACIPPGQRQLIKLALLCRIMQNS